MHALKHPFSLLHWQLVGAVCPQGGQKKQGIICVLLPNPHDPQNVPAYLLYGQVAYTYRVKYVCSCVADGCAVCQVMPGGCAVPELLQALGESTAVQQPGRQHWLLADLCLH